MQKNNKYQSMIKSRLKFLINKNISRFSAFVPRLFRVCSASEGFGLLEAMVSIFIMITVITGAMALVSGGILNIGVAEDRLVAINLAQEGLEVVHNIRDTNWLANRGWNRWRNGSPGDHTLPPSASGATTCATCYVLWDSQSLTTSTTIRDLKWNEGDKHYEEGGGANDFRRIITITNDPDGIPGTPDVSIKATVGWGGTGSCTEGGIDSGRKYCVTLEERLYNWLQ